MKQYLLSKARNPITGETVKTQDLTGARLDPLNPVQRRIAEELAEQLAGKMTARTGISWQPFTELYTPTERR